MYEPANTLPSTKFGTFARLELTPEKRLILTGGFEYRLGVARQLYVKWTDATTDDTTFKRSWESIWQSAAAGETASVLLWDDYTGSVDGGDPETP